jgi:dihydroneopterin aldolase
MKSEIILKDMYFFAYHGLLPQEAVVGNDFIVNLTLSVDITRAIETDDVNDTVNYADVYQMVKAEMQQRSNLLEHVAGRIAHRLLHDFPSVTSVDIQVEKLNPPMKADIHSAAIHLVLP